MLACNYDDGDGDGDHHHHDYFDNDESYVKLTKSDASRPEPGKTARIARMYILQSLTDHSPSKDSCDSYDSSLFQIFQSLRDHGPSKNFTIEMILQSLG